MYCFKCGRPVEEDAEFCPECHASLKCSGYAAVSVAEWFWTKLVCWIPVVNIIMLIAFSVDYGVNPSKRNWARATLLWIIMPFVVIAAIMFVALIIVLIATLVYGGANA